MPTKTKTLAVTEISKRFQTTIPKEVRDRLKITRDDKVLWIEEKESEDIKIIVRKA